MVVKDTRPNIIIFMTDQQNGDTIKPDHQTKTPNLNRFLNDAVYFENAYCPSPHCCPCRATFFSGMYPSQHGVWNNVEVDNALSRGLYNDVVLFPEILQKKGYRTVFSGKWHVSAYEGPKDRGFDIVLREYISNYGRMKNDNRPHFNDWEKVHLKGMPIDGEHEEKSFGRIIRPGYPTYYQFGVDQNPFGDTTTVELACKEITEGSLDKPLFLYIGTTGPHDPYCPPSVFLDWYKEEEIKLPESFYDKMEDKPALYRRTKEQFALSEEEQIESIRRYMAFVSYEDALFGKVLDAVEKRGIQDNTIIIYLTDHGDYMGAHGLWAKGLPCFREAYHICAAVRGPGMRAGRDSHFISLADFAPTILECAGISPDERMQGCSLWGILHGETMKEWRTEMYTQTNGNEVYGIQRAVWNHKWKYVYNSFDYDELYDLEKDPFEQVNVINLPENKSIIKKMCKKMWEFAQQTGDGCTCPYIMVGLAPYGPGIVLEETDG